VLDLQFADASSDRIQIRLHGQTPCGGWTAFKYIAKPLMGAPMEGRAYLRFAGYPALECRQTYNPQQEEK
jgi:hypothetical protein